MKLLQNLMAFLLFAVSIPSTAAVDIIDLKEDWVVGNTQNPLALTAIQELETNFRDIRRFLMIENGEIVLDYQRDNVDDSDVYNLWSGTKSIMGMILSHIMESGNYNLGLNMTLGEIFADNEGAWIQITNETELEFKQAVTIYELMTMSSGLTFDFFAGMNVVDLLTVDVANWQGRNISETMTRHGYNATLKGTYQYLMASNLLSYVVLEVTGRTPFEYISQEIFVHIGINPEEVQWDTNDEGVNTAMSNLRLTAKQWAKISQLWLQKGLAAPGKRILSEKLVEDSLAYKNKMFPDDPVNFVGYFWLGMRYNIYEPSFLGTVHCGSGFHGQSTCFEYETGRISVVQRSNTYFDIANWFIISNTLAMTSMSTNWSFTLPPTVSPAPTTVPEPTEAPLESSASGLSFSWAAWMIIAVASLVGIRM